MSCIDQVDGKIMTALVERNMLDSIYSKFVDIKYIIALTASTTAESAHYPFCTIEPNVEIVVVSGRILDRLRYMPKN